VVVGQPIEPVVTDDKAGDIDRIMMRINLEIEQMVRAYPEQWLWLHDRWRVRPPAEVAARWEAKQSQRP
jgi:KDO2-lipid IV(A) lauroyltransferase